MIPTSACAAWTAICRSSAAIEVDSAFRSSRASTSQRRVIVTFDPGEDPNSDKGMLVVNWLLAETDDPELLPGLSILAHILIGTPASPLRKALIDSGLGEDLAGGGLGDRAAPDVFLDRSERHRSAAGRALCRGR